MTLTEFLLARIAEDEGDAHAADDPYGVGEPWGYAHIADDGPHLARWNPTRVLAECQARRAAITEVGRWQHESVDDCWYSCGLAVDPFDGSSHCCNDENLGRCTCGLDIRRDRLLGFLALPYADHPDFDPEWRTAAA